MDNLIPKLYREYGLYVNESRAFPLSQDGLKPVERRILLSAYQVAKDKFVKSVRVDAHCLVGKTKIKITNGIKTIEELYKENYRNFYIFGYDLKLNKPIITKADCVSLTKFVNKIIRITTESGIIECTEDHLWLTKEGEYKETKELIIDDSLEVMEFGIPDKNNIFKNNWVGCYPYEVVENNGNFYKSHFLADEYNCKNNLEILFELIDGFDRHHKDKNILNNDPDNITRMIVGDHLKLHYNFWFNYKNGKIFLSENGKRIQREHPEIAKALVEFTKQKSIDDPTWLSNNGKKCWNNLNEEDRKKLSRKIGDGIRKFYRENGSEEKSKKTIEYWKQDSELVKIHREKNRSAGVITSKKNFENNHKIKILKTLKKIIDKNLDLNEETYNSNREKLYPLYNKILKYFNSYEEANEEAKKYTNHTILNIEEINLETPIPVYDIINSENYHNFVVMFDDNTGVISHNCLGHYHPHSTVYQSIVQLVHQGFLDGQGNFGNNIGLEPSPAAAMRYTECKLSKFINNIAFRLIDYVPWGESELDDEPEYIPSMFPLCLLGKEYTVGIGFGYKTLIPCYTPEDLKSRLFYLLGKTKEKPIIKPITDCKILSTDKDFEELLTTGKAVISFQGIHKIDNVKSKAVIKNWPPGKRFESILSKFDKELTNQDIGFIDESSKDNGGTHIVFEVLKSRNKNDIFRTFSKKLGDVLKGSISFEMIVVDSESRTPKLMSVDEMLLKTYNMYKATNEIMLKSEEKRFKDLINENKLIQKIKPSLSKQLQSKETDVDKIIDAISADTFIDRNVVKDIIQKHRISKLLSVKNDLKELEIRIVDIVDCIKNIDKFVLKQYT